MQQGNQMTMLRQTPSILLPAATCCCWVADSTGRAHAWTCPQDFLHTSDFSALLLSHMRPQQRQPSVLAPASDVWQLSTSLLARQQAPAAAAAPAPAAVGSAVASLLLAAADGVVQR
jgi:hypothetical protein